MTGAKRLLDVLLSGAGLAVAAPVALLLALAIKLEDGGPVFFAQQRVGRHGRLFNALKFRSMIPDAEAGVGPVQSGQHEIDVRGQVQHKLPDGVPRRQRAVGRRRRRNSAQ